MSNFRLMTSLLTYTPAATSADSNWPVTNLALYTRLTKKWAAAVATGVVDVTLDLGSGNTLSGLAADPGIFIDDINVTSIRIQANSSSSWATPPWDQAVTVGKHKGVARYKGFWRFADLSASAVAYRYVNVRITSQTPVDAANYRISRIGLGTITELTANPSYGMSYGRNRRVITTEMQDGGVEVNLMGPPYWLATFEGVLPNTTARDQHWDINAIGEGQPFVLWDASEAASQDAWMMIRVENSPLVKEYKDRYRVSGWTHREAV